MEARAGPPAGAGLHRPGEGSINARPTGGGAEPLRARDLGSGRGGSVRPSGGAWRASVRQGGQIMKVQRGMVLLVSHEAGG